MKVIWNSLTFFTSTELVLDGLITADEMLQSTGIELSEVRVPLLKFVNDKPTADKVPLIYICPVCGKKYKQQISMQNIFHSVNYRRMIQLQIKPINFLMTTLLLYLNWPMVSFLVSTLLQIMVKTEKGRSNLKWYETL